MKWGRKDRKMRTLLLVCDTLDVKSVAIGGIEVSTRSSDGLNGLDTGENNAHKSEGGCDAWTHS